MIAQGQIIAIEQAIHLGDYKIELVFNDEVKQVVDFYPFLSASLNPLIRKYLHKNVFAGFSIEDGDLEWNDYDLCFPVADLYENRIIP